MAESDTTPANYHSVTPYLCVDGAAAAIDFYREVFEATERGDRYVGPDGKIGHAELRLGDSVIMLADEHPDIGFLSPRSIGGSPVVLHVYVPDVDSVFARAAKAGGRVLREIEAQFYGDRSGQFEDPFGHRWNVGTHVEDISPEEMARRAEEQASGR